MTLMLTAPTTTTAELLLVRLLAPAKKPLGPARLRADLNRLLREPLDSSRWEALVDDLAATGDVSTKPLRLTASGRSRALQFLGVSGLPERINWAGLRDRFLVPLALGIGADAGELRRRIQNLENLGCLLLKRRYNLPKATGQTLNAALEALVCQQLGFPEETQLASVRDAVLHRLLQVPTRLTKKQLSRHLIQLAAGASRAELASVREAVLRDWLQGPTRGAGFTQTNGHVTPPPPEPKPFDLAAFAATVRAAARNCPTGHFGGNKVFIHHVWRCLQDEPSIPMHTLDEFKQRLVEANHAGLLHLSRADLVQAMDPADVQQAETRYLDAVFHFILLDKERP